MAILKPKHTWFENPFGVTRESIDYIEVYTNNAPENSSYHWGAASAGSIGIYIVDTFDNQGTSIRKLIINGEGNTIYMNPDSSYIFSDENADGVLDYFKNLKKISGSNLLQPQGITTLLHAFYQCNSLESVDVSHWLPAGNSTTMIYGMFFENYNLKTCGSTTNWDTRNLVSMRNAFRNCYALEELDTSNWRGDNLYSIKQTFDQCRALKNIDLSNLFENNADGGPGELDYCFRGCGEMTELNINSWNVSKVKDFQNLFNGMSKLTEIDISSWDTSSATNMSYMFASTGLIHLDISNFNTSNVQNMSAMFSNSTKLQSLNLGSNFDTSNVTNMDSMFKLCRSLITVDTSTFDTSKVTNMQSMFDRCDIIQDVQLSHFNTQWVENFYRMFAQALQFNTLNQVENWDTGSATHMGGMFARNQVVTKLDLSRWNVSGVNNFYHMFYETPNLTELNIDNWETLQEVTAVDRMFDGTGLIHIKLPKMKLKADSVLFRVIANNPNLETVNIVNCDFNNPGFCREMFVNNPKLKYISGLSKLDTSQCTSTAYMFKGCTNLESLDLTNFDLNNVAPNDYVQVPSEPLTQLTCSEGTTGMFEGCENLKWVKISRGLVPNGNGTCDALVFPAPCGGGDWYGKDELGSWSPESIPYIDTNVVLYYIPYSLATVDVRNLMDLANMFRDISGKTEGLTATESVEGLLQCKGRF